MSLNYYTNKKQETTSFEVNQDMSVGSAMYFYTKSSALFYGC